MKLWLLCIATGVSLCLSPFDTLAQQEGPVGDGAAESEREEPRERGVRRLGDVIGEGSSEFSMDIPQIDMPVAPVIEQPDVSLPDPAMDDRLQNILARRAFVPDNAEIEQELVDLLDEVEAEARQAMANGDMELATRFANVIAEFDDERGIVDEVEAEVERLAELQRLLGLANQALATGNLVQPADASAWVLFQQAET